MLNQIVNLMLVKYPTGGNWLSAQVCPLAAWVLTESVLKSCVPCLGLATLWPMHIATWAGLRLAPWQHIEVPGVISIFPDCSAAESGCLEETGLSLVVVTEDAHGLVFFKVLSAFPSRTVLIRPTTYSGHSIGLMSILPLRWASCTRATPALGRLSSSLMQWIPFWKPRP